MVWLSPASSSHPAQPGCPKVLRAVPSLRISRAGFPSMRLGKRCVSQNTVQSVQPNSIFLRHTLQSSSYGTWAIEPIEPSARSPALRFFLWCRGEPRNDVMEHGRYRGWMLEYLVCSGYSRLGARVCRSEYALNSRFTSFFVLLRNTIMEQALGTSGVER